MGRREPESRSSRALISTLGSAPLAQRARERGDSFILFCQSIKFLMKTMFFKLSKMTKLGKTAKHGDFLGLGTRNLFPVKILFHKYVPWTQPAETEAVN